MPAPWMTPWRTPKRRSACSMTPRMAVASATLAFTYRTSPPSFSIFRTAPMLVLTGSSAGGLPIHASQDSLPGRRRDIEIDIDTLHADIGVLLTNHHARPQQRRFLRADGFRTRDLVDVVGKREQLDLVSHVVCGERTGQKHQAEKASGLRLRETVARRLSCRNAGDTPGMHDAIRQGASRLQGSDQQVIVLRVRGFDGERVRVRLLKACADPHGHHGVTSGLEPCHQGGGQPGIIGTYQPRSGDRKSVV